MINVIKFGTIILILPGKEYNHGHEQKLASSYPTNELQITLGCGSF